MFYRCIFTVALFLKFEFEFTESCIFLFSLLFRFSVCRRQDLICHSSFPVSLFCVAPQICDGDTTERERELESGGGGIHNLLSIIKMAHHHFPLHRGNLFENYFSLSRATFGKPNFPLLLLFSQTVANRS